MIEVPIPNIPRPYGKAKKEGKADIVQYFESRGIKE
jgi:hypothetical protein